MKAFAKIIDALDIETFLHCQDENEGRKLAAALMEELSLSDFDIVDIKQLGPGARVRIRAYINRPGDYYTWLEEEQND